MRYLFLIMHSLRAGVIFLAALYILRVAFSLIFGFYIPAIIHIVVSDRFMELFIKHAENYPAFFEIQPFGLTASVLITSLGAALGCIDYFQESDKFMGINDNR